MLRPVSRIAVALVITAVTACGQSPEQGNASRVAGLSTGVQPVFVTAGGLMSCKTPWSTPVGTHIHNTTSGLIETLRQDRGHDSIPFVASCHNISGNELWYQTSDYPDDTWSGDESDVVAEVRRLVEQVDGPAELVLMGHSYGAWMLMRHLDELAAIAPVAFLGTLDPISREDCTPEVFLQLLAGFGDVGTCTNSPRDLESVYPSIQEQTGRWENYYQSTYSYLHASPIAYADTNTEVYFDLMWPLQFRAHQLIDRDDQVYGPVASWLRR